MGQAIGDILAPAVGVALSPMPIIAVILMLFTPQARRNGTAFSAGWVLGILGIGSIVLLVADPAGASGSTEDPSTFGAILHLILGAALLLLAGLQWRKRPNVDPHPQTPRWMQSIDKFSPPMALAFGAFMSGVNPKNLILNIAAGSSIAQADLLSGDAIVALLAYTFVASVSIVGVVGWALLSGESADVRLNEMKGWLSSHNAVIMVVLLGILGISQIGKGVGML
jgi:threonine/homoserine/homoserine lactone efflux protein